MPNTANTFAQPRRPLPVRLLNRAGAAAEKIGLKRSPFQAAELIETAKRRTGLDDFGGGEFFEPLSRLLESAHRETHLNVIGRIALKTEVIGTLENRLLMQRDRQLNPEIAGQEIRQPLFVVGLPRSGTTFLHALLAADPDHRVPLTWEVRSPSPPTNVDVSRRINRARRELASFRWLAPNFAAVHPMDAESPQECISLLAPTFLSDQFDTMFNVPSYRSWYLNQDFVGAYQDHRRFLQQLQQRKRSARWVLKAPAHMFAASALLAVYPDALFVQMHRDPVEAVASVSSLVVILRSVFSDAIDPIQIGRDAVVYWTEAIKRFLAERARLSSNRICDFRLDELRKDPIGVVRRIYTHFGWPLSAVAEQQMRGVVAQSQPDRNGSHRYQPSEFGITNSTAFDAYRERFGLKVGASDAADNPPRVDRALRRSMLN